MMVWFKDHFCLKVCVTLGMLLIGCHAQTTIRVELPHGFTGTVRIHCGTYGSGQTITVEATGLAPGAACPEKPAKLVIVREGKVIQSIDPAMWGTTGDGLPVHARGNSTSR